MQKSFLETLEEEQTMNEVQFIDAENFTGGKDQDISFRFIVLEHLRRIMRLGSEEWHGGVYKEFAHPSGVVNRVYVPATHESYSNAVRGLADLLFPLLDDEAKQADDKAIKEEKELMRKHFNEKANPLPKGSYQLSRVLLYRELFRALSAFLSRKGYLESSVYEETDS